MPNATTNEIVDLALTRLQEYRFARPVVRSVLFRRISLRQQELAVMASRVSRDYYGVAATATVVNGAVDVNDISDPVPWPEFIHKVTVGAIGGGATVAVGDEVSIVRLGDEAGEEPPRVTLRSGVMRQVGSDLNGITSLKVFYSSIPGALLASEDGTSPVAIPAPFDELLVLDLVTLMMRRGLTGTADDGPTVTAITALDAERGEWEGKWSAHVAAYGARRSRFDR